jgi:hypothetical protein
MAKHWSSYARGEAKQRGVMNLTEGQFADLLDVQQAAGEVIQWWYESITFKLTDTPADKRADGVPIGKLSDKTRLGTRYTPDFSVLLADYRMIHYEVKGTGIATTADLNRVKAAAEKYPFRFYVATKQTKAAGGGFKIEEF